MVLVEFPFSCVDLRGSVPEKPLHDRNNKSEKSMRGPHKQRNSSCFGGPVAGGWGPVAGGWGPVAGGWGPVAGGRLEVKKLDFCPGETIPPKALFPTTKPFENPLF
jgi:hypothetical protein